LRSLASAPNSPNILTTGALGGDPGRIAFLEQGDYFFEQLTVSETLNVARVLQQSGDDDGQVNKLLKQLGLNGLEDRCVGGKSNLFRRGGKSDGALSGGERRRLSLLMNILGPLNMLLADEPTSGLDSTQSYNVVKLLKRIGCDRNVPVVLTIHQPRTRIFNALDYVMLMAPGGRVVYFGLADNAVAYFNSIGYVTSRGNEHEERSVPNSFL